MQWVGTRVVDVPMIVQLEFQHYLRTTVGVEPQSQFLDRVPDIPVGYREGYAQCEGAPDSVL